MISIKVVNLFCFDFDGVLTNNKVYLDQNGKEQVMCDRSDGIAFDALRKLNKRIYIVSSEKNDVVKKRAKKLKINVLNGVKNKENALEKISRKEGIPLDNAIFIGNDINDIGAMKLCKYSACPSDSHSKVKSISKIKLKSKGGDGIVRELLEGHFRIDLQSLLYNGNSKG